MPAKAVVVDGLVVPVYAIGSMTFMWVAQMVGQRLSDHLIIASGIAVYIGIVFTSALVELCRPSEREK